MKKKCYNCNKELKPFWLLAEQAEHDSRAIIARKTTDSGLEFAAWGVGYLGHNYFCTLKCGYRYALRSIHQRG